MRKASLGTLFLTVFLDLLGFGLVIPFLPGVARSYGASDSVATLIGTAYSLMQFICIPLWGRLSDRVGRRPVLLWSVAASVLGMTMLGFANSLLLLFLARLFSGAATANIAVAHAYIADVTLPEDRARGMGLIGVSFGLGFIFGPYIGGELGHVAFLGRPGALAAFVAAGLSALNFGLALRFLPESLGKELRGAHVRSASPFSLARFREAWGVSGIGAALVVQFLVLFAFAGMELTFPLFTADGFGMNAQGTGRVFGFIGIIVALVQGGLIRPLTRAFGETRLLRAGVTCEAISFVLLGYSPHTSHPVFMLFTASGLIALGSGLVSPSVTSYVSRRSSSHAQGSSLGVLQSMGALGRVFGPAVAGLIYQAIGHSSTYYVAGGELLIAALLTFSMHRTLGNAQVPSAQA